jgi:hypothetical protein
VVLRGWKLIESQIMASGLGRSDSEKTASQNAVCLIYDGEIIIRVAVDGLIVVFGCLYQNHVVVVVE